MDQFDLNDIYNPIYVVPERNAWTLVLVVETMLLATLWMCKLSLLLVYKHFA